MRRALSVLAASTVATTAGAFSVNPRLTLEPNRGRDVAAGGGVGAGIAGAEAARRGSTRGRPAPRTLLRSTSVACSGSSASSYSVPGRRPLTQGSPSRQQATSPSRPSMLTQVLLGHSSRGGVRAGVTEHQPRSSWVSSSSRGGATRAGLAAAERLGRRKVAEGRRRGGDAREGGVALEAYRYLNTYHDGISDEDREWNKFEEKDFVELGTSGLRVSRVRHVTLFVIGVPLGFEPFDHFRKYM